MNLAGAPVAVRWTDAAKREIERSRVDLPRAFLSALERVEHRPKAYVSASAIGYYGISRTATFTETSPPGGDFLARVCVAWEAEAARAATLGMRVAILRTGLVLGRDGGALAKLLPLFRLGLGGPVASGEQWNSWIHLDDHIALYLLLLAVDGFNAGTLNATAPQPVTNREFTRALAAAVHQPALFPAPEFALKARLRRRRLDRDRRPAARAARGGIRRRVHVPLPADRRGLREPRVISPGGPRRHSFFSSRNARA